MKRLLANFLFTFADAIGLNWLARKMTRRQIRILMYHGVEEHGREANRWTVIDAPSFAWQMTYLAKHYQTVRVSSLWPDAPAGLQSIRPRAVVTFDDGLLNTLATAQPILAALNLPAVCFVLPGLSVAQRQIWADECFAYLMNARAEVLNLEQYHLGTIPLSKDREKRTASAEAVIEQMKTWPQSKRDDFVAKVARADMGEGQSNSTYGLMTLEQIRMMADAGVFDIGVHSNSHPIMASLTKEEQYREIAEAMDLLRKNQISFVPVFAYPNGRPCDFNESTIEVLEQLGFVAGLTTVDGLADPEGEPFRVKRIGIGSPISRGEFKARLSGLFYLLHTLLAGTNK